MKHVGLLEDKSFPSEMLRVHVFNLVHNMDMIWAFKVLRNCNQDIERYKTFVASWTQKTRFEDSQHRKEVFLRLLDQFRKFKSTFQSKNSPQILKYLFLRLQPFVTSPTKRVQVAVQVSEVKALA